MSKPYDRLPKETKKAWAAFVTYRKLGPQRTIAKVAAEYKQKQGAYEMYSKKYHWVSRALAWDEDLDRAEREAEIEAIKEMRQRHVEVSMELQELGRLALTSYLEKAKKEGKTVDPDEMLKVIKEGTALERLTRGEPDQIAKVEVKENIDYSQLSPDDLKELRTISRKLKAKKDA